MDHRWWRLPVVHEALPLPLVDAIQLYSCDGTRCGRHHRSHRHLLFLAMASQWHLRQLVGQRRLEKYCGREDDPFEDTRSRSNFWANYMVMTHSDIVRPSIQELSHV